MVFFGVCMLKTNDTQVRKKQPPARRRKDRPQWSGKKKRRGPTGNCRLTIDRRKAERNIAADVRLAPVQHHDRLGGLVGRRRAAAHDRTEFVAAHGHGAAKRVRGMVFNAVYSAKLNSLRPAPAHTHFMIVVCIFCAMSGASVPIHSSPLPMALNRPTSM